MLQSIFEYLKSIWGWIKSGFEFLVEFISGWAQLASLVWDVGGELPGYVTWLPAGCVTIFGIVIVIVVFYKFFGRT